jgi:hypothetical protein
MAADLKASAKAKTRMNGEEISDKEISGVGKPAARF